MNQEKVLGETIATYISTHLLTLVVVVMVHWKHLDRSCAMEAFDSQSERTAVLPNQRRKQGLLAS